MTKPKEVDVYDQGGHKATQGHHHSRKRGDGGSKPPASKPRLTEQMKMACFVFLETGDKTEAYRQVYQPDPRAKHTTKRAYELFRMPQVQEFLEALYERARERHEINIDTITKQLLEDRQLAFSCEDPKAAVAADLGLAKLHGLLIDRKKLSVAGSLEHHIRNARERAAISGNIPPPNSYSQAIEEIEDAEYAEVGDD